MRNRIANIPLESYEEDLERQLAKSNLLRFNRGAQVSVEYQVASSPCGHVIGITFLVIGNTPATVLGWKRLS